MATTRRGERTRIAFRDAAREVIADKGFLRTTIADVAAVAGRSPASFYNYYDSKEDLLEELADEFRHDADAHDAIDLPDDTSMYDVMRRTAEAYWTAYRRHLPELVGVFQTAMLNDRFAERWRAIRLAGIGAIEARVEQAQARGYCPGLDPAQLAAALGSMLEHFCFVSLAQGGAFADHPVDDRGAIDTMASILYRSIFWTDDGPQPTIGAAVR